MDLLGILKQLREEFAQLNKSILALERIEAGGRPKRGRPPNRRTHATRSPRAKKENRDQ
jgi:hypothetical protein